MISQEPSTPCAPIPTLVRESALARTLKANPFAIEGMPTPGRQPAPVHRLSAQISNLKSAVRPRSRNLAHYMTVNSPPKSLPQACPGLPFLPALSPNGHAIVARSAINKPLESKPCSRFLPPFPLAKRTNASSPRPGRESARNPDLHSADYPTRIPGAPMCINSNDAV